jgi:hypothetical protein
MLLNTQELGELADFMLCEIDCSADYEDDCFGVEWQGRKLYVERYRTHFRIELGHQHDVVEIPRH